MALRSLITSLLAMAALAAPAAAAQPVAPADLSALSAHGPVRDVVRPAVRVPARARTASARRTETFVDEHGHVIRLATSHPDADLRQMAGVLAAIRHGAEIEAVRVEVLPLADIPAACGGGPGVVACYGAVDPDTKFDGVIFVSADDADRLHALVHEYGHHVDNQLLNLRHLGIGCGFANDGSRNWFFARQVEDDILSGVSCDPANDWDRLLGEVFAEDYVALNGLQTWTLPSVPAPTQGQLDALATDMRQRFRPSTARWTANVAPRRSQTEVVHLPQWSFADIAVKGPDGSDVDLVVSRRGEQRPVVRATGPGPGERVERLLAPGTYEIRVVARRGRGRAQVLAAVN